MHLSVNGARLYVDIEGAGTVPDGATMRDKPTLVLLHGGPGLDHSLFKPAFSQLADVAQVVYLDHRGNGRSSQGDPSSWNLAQWGDDVRGVCDVLGITKPIVYGVSFGGFVAQSYATRHPDHPGKLVLASTAAQVDWPAVFDAFERIGGAEAREVARARWLTPTPERRAAYNAVCYPLYYTRPIAEPQALARAIAHDPVNQHFATGEWGRMDLRTALARVACPTLVMAGDRDPITPIAFSETIVAHLPPALTRFERFAGCGHGIVNDAPERHFELLREFIRQA
ncbi:alpha/beta hydrolase [Comamonadaceae bacterium G21597-S1]|nr:alpha/beta hydrolase [Comamonadaceae bacterium G21597-S1]